MIHNTEYYNKILYLKPKCTEWNSHNKKERQQKYTSTCNPDGKSERGICWNIGRYTSIQKMRRFSFIIHQMSFWRQRLGKYAYAVFRWCPYSIPTIYPYYQLLSAFIMSMWSIWRRHDIESSSAILSYSERNPPIHFTDVIMTTIASQITSPMVVYSTVYSDADQGKYQSSAPLAFVWGIHRDRWIPRTKGQLRGKCFHLMTSSCHQWIYRSRVDSYHKTFRTTELWCFLFCHTKHLVEQTVIGEIRRLNTRQCKAFTRIRRGCYLNAASIVWVLRYYWNNLKDIYKADQ